VRKFQLAGVLSARRRSAASPGSSLSSSPSCHLISWRLNLFIHVLVLFDDASPRSIAWDLLPLRLACFPSRDVRCISRSQTTSLSLSSIVWVTVGASIRSSSARASLSPFTVCRSFVSQQRSDPSGFIGERRAHKLRTGSLQKRLDLNEV
jgi:hypothetical protein